MYTATHLGDGLKAVNMLSPSYMMLTSHGPQTLVTEAQRRVLSWLLFIYFVSISILLPGSKLLEPPKYGASSGTREGREQANRSPPPPPHQTLVHGCLHPKPVPPPPPPPQQQHQDHLLVSLIRDAQANNGHQRHTPKMLFLAVLEYVFIYALILFIYSCVYLFVC